MAKINENTNAEMTYINNTNKYKDEHTRYSHHVCKHKSQIQENAYAAKTVNSHTTGTQKQEDHNHEKLGIPHTG